MMSASKPCSNPLFLKGLEPLAEMEYFYDFLNFFVKKPFSIMKMKNSEKVKIMFRIKDATLSGAGKVDNSLFS